MFTLGIDTATRVGSIGIVEDGKPLAEITLNIDVTHSERLLSSIDFLLKSLKLEIKDIDLVAYAKGPGSFTGLRIGLSTVKGIIFSTGKKMVGVSSLEILGMNLYETKYPICPMMDARKNEIYSAIYEFDAKGKLKVFKRESAISPDDLIKSIKKKTIFFGDGARLYHDLIKKRLKSKAIFAPIEFDNARGINVALLGLTKFKRGIVDDLESAVPNYLRKSEAEIHFKG